MPAPVLVTKLYIPPVCSYQVPRPRLVERLTAGLVCKLVLVSAPAGFGKTTLLADWAATHTPPRRVAWLSLDEADNNPVRFLAYLIAALQRACESVGRDVTNNVFDQVDDSASLADWVQVVLTILINQVCAVTESLALVLDDYHLIHAQPIHDALMFLLDHLPDNWRLIIATRSDPPLALARLRGRGQLSELRQNELCFTPDEAATFLNEVMGLHIDATAVAALAARTEGWVAGLQMAAVSLQGRSDVQAFVDAFTGSQHHILDYLVEEVLQRQTEQVQAFLLQTSILDRMCGPLCDAVTGDHDSQMVLDFLEHANLFVFPLDENQQWYRYHHLFADLLRHRLHQTQPDRLPELHLRASSWYESQGQWPSAVEHALAAGDLERAAHLNAHSLDTPRGLVAALDHSPAADQSTAPIEPLSDRELEVLRLLAADYSSTAIARQLFISVNTARSHIRRLYEKLDAHSRLEALQHAHRLHLV